MGSASAQYWFQSGVRASNDAAQNNGAGVAIQTVYQSATNGSLGYWVGEDLSNGAFLQAGYEITNATGYYPSECDVQGCTGSVYLTAGKPTWFWEYFPSGYTGSSFLGGIGPDGSAGINNTFHTYSFRSNGGTAWSFYFDNTTLGTVDLGATGSGPNPPSAFGEYAQTNTNTYPMQVVAFKNMTFYQNGRSYLVPQGYSYIGYGKGSEEILPNRYGVQEYGNRTDYFQVGTGLALAGQTTLWTLGYNLNVVSAYGNLTSNGNYKAYSRASLSAPSYINITNGTRESFAGWRGSGTGSYTGNLTTAPVQMYGNITETAVWQRQYYVGTNASYGAVSGSGWYDAGSTASLSVNYTTVPTAYGTRAAFAGWSTGSNSTRISFAVNSPVSVSARWETQYLVNATTQYGQVSGTGWYNANSTATLSLTETAIKTGPNMQLGFLDWSSGAKNSTIKLKVTAPVSMSAIFATQYKVTFSPQNAYGQQLAGVDYYNVSSNVVNTSAYLFANRTYNIEYVSYKGVNVSTNYVFNLTSPKTISFQMPIYNVTVRASSAFGTPLNASYAISFKNGTRMSGFLGQKGSISFSNVPYGYVSGSAKYFGLAESISIANGNDANMIFFTPWLIYVIVIGVAIIGITAALAEREYKKRHSAAV
ncbi:MAG: hypothetical protein KGH60_01345 [Candidatus Micrarchaeota archaeon]|nr:hypothetical protein [Candidatus Micrarchaeota archaeon]